MCSMCPVQADSKCVKEKLQSAKELMESMPAGEFRSGRGSRDILLHRQSYL